MKTFIALILLTLALPASAQYRTAEEQEHARCAALNTVFLAKFGLDLTAEQAEITIQRIEQHTRAAVITSSLLKTRVRILNQRIDAGTLERETFLALVVECTYL